MSFSRYSGFFNYWTFCTIGGHKSTPTPGSAVDKVDLKYIKKVPMIAANRQVDVQNIQLNASSLVKSFFYVETSVR
jgi:hypothetical protein